METTLPEGEAGELIQDTVSFSVSPETMAQFEVGARLGKYVVVGHAGSGGMSVVLLAYDPELDRRVALKLLRTRAMGQGDRARLVREAQALARLSHPHIVPVYDLCTSRDRVFLAMEYIEGQTLDSWLAKGQSLGSLLRVIGDVGRGLAAAHHAGIVHRDVKPANLLVGDDGRVRIVDFGIALDAAGGAPTEPGEPEVASEPVTGGAHRPLPMVTRDGAGCGTPAFMAPEQATDSQVDARADQYSLAVTLFRALYNDLPQRLQLTSDGADRVVPLRADALRALPSKFGSIPTHVQHALTRALNPRPEQRFDTMDEFVRALSPRDSWLRRYAGWALAVVAVAIGVGQAVWTRTAPGAACAHGPARLAEVWSASQRSLLRKAFARAGGPYAGPAFERISGQLEQYASSWLQGYQEACEATHVRKDQSVEAMDLRMTCLSDRMRELRALVRELGREGSQQQLALTLSDATRTLTPVATCEHVASLRAVSPLPTDPSKRQAIDRARESLASARAAMVVGRSTEAQLLLRDLEPKVRKVGYQPLSAELYFWQARTATDVDQDEEAKVLFRRASRVAIASGADDIAVEAALRLAQEHLFDDGSPLHNERYSEWMGLSQALLERTGGNEHLKETAKRIECLAYFNESKLNEKHECLREVRENAVRRDKLDHWILSNYGLSLADMGYLREGIEEHRRALALTRKQFGDVHPELVSDGAFLVAALVEAGYFEEAVREATHVLDLSLKLGSDAVEQVPLARLVLARALRGAGQLEASRTQFELVASSQDEYNKPLALVQLGLVEAALGDPAAAERHIERGMELHRIQVGEVHAIMFEDLLARAQVQVSKAPRLALSSLEEAFALAKQAPPGILAVLPARLMLAELPRTLVPDERARREARAALDALEQLGINTPTFEALAKRARAILQQSEGT